MGGTQRENMIVWQFKGIIRKDERGCIGQIQI